MLYRGDLLVLEGAECGAFQFLFRHLAQDVGVNTATRRTWNQYSQLDESSRGAVSAGALRVLSAFLLIKSVQPDLGFFPTLDVACQRSQVLRSPAASISHQPHPMVMPDPVTGKALLSGTAYPVRKPGIRLVM